MSACFFRISDIRPRVLLHQAMNGRFGEAAPQRRHALDRRLWAECSLRYPFARFLLHRLNKLFALICDAKPFHRVVTQLRPGTEVRPFCAA